MCGHAEDINRVIHHLTEEVYPVLIDTIKSAMSGKIVEAIDDVDGKEIMQGLIEDIKNEFCSLVTYEQKLVFPSVLKVFSESNQTVALPNLADLLQLTKSKEHKIMHHIRKLSMLLETISSDFSEQKELTEIFFDRFVNEKAIWYKMVEERMSTCTCYRKEYFELTHKYTKKGETKSQSN